MYSFLFDYSFIYLFIILLTTAFTSFPSRQNVSASLPSHFLLKKMIIIMDFVADLDSYNQYVFVL